MRRDHRADRFPGLLKQKSGYNTQAQGDVAYEKNEKTI